MNHPRHAWGRRGAWLAIATLGLVLVTTSTALAHVTVTPSTAETGATAELTFRVPNEEAKAATTRVTIQVPTEHPIAQVLARSVPGWHVSVRTTKLAKLLTTDDGTFATVVSQVTWSGGRILPGQYQDFSLSADPLPDQATTLVFKALQGYSNGDVVRWIDLSQPGQDEPEHPAPTLTIVKAGATSSDGSMSDMPGMTDKASSAGAAQSSSSSGKGLAWSALGVSVLAALLGAGALVASRRRA